MAAATQNIPATIVMPRHASLSKQLASKSYGGEVILWGEAEEYAKELAKEGYTMIHPCDDEDIIAGQGANILHIHHERTSPEVPLGTSKVVLELETVGFDHIQGILRTLRKENYEVKMDPTCPVG